MATRLQRVDSNTAGGDDEASRTALGELAEAYDLLLVPFLMEGVALVDGMMQDDGIHPNAAAQPVMLDNVWEVLAPALSAP